MATETDRASRFVLPAAAALLLWPAVWNGYPIVFADTGTYISQAIQHYAGWDRPVFYSLFMLPLHATVTLWPVVVAQALLAAWLLHRTCRAVVPAVPGGAFLAGIACLGIASWLPWLTSELMPDLFTPLLILTVCLLGLTPDRLSGRERGGLTLLAAFLIATQLSSLPLAAGLVVAIWTFKHHVPGRRAGTACPPMRQAAMRQGTLREGAMRDRRVNLRLGIPLALAVLALCSVNLAAFGRFAVAPFGNIFLLARVIYDGPGMTVLRQDCPTRHWRLCPYLDAFPASSDGFLWTRSSPLNRAGGPKRVSREADAIIDAALRTAPLIEAGAATRNTLQQLVDFRSGDGLTPWPAQVTPWLRRDFPRREVAAYQAARQQAGSLRVPRPLGALHVAVAVAGTLACLLLLPGALRRRDRAAGFLVIVLFALPLSAAITGGLSTPHDRYQARIMWLPPFVAALAMAERRSGRGIANHGGPA